MKLSQYLIDHGPFASGDGLTEDLLYPPSGAFNELREELMAWQLNDIRAISTQGLLRELARRGEARRMRDALGGVTLYDAVSQLMGTLSTEVLEEVPCEE